MQLVFQSTPWTHWSILSCVSEPTGVTRSSRDAGRGNTPLAAGCPGICSWVAKGVPPAVVLPRRVSTQCCRPPHHTHRLSTSGGTNTRFIRGVAAVPESPAQGPALAVMSHGKEAHHHRRGGVASCPGAAAW